MNVMRHICNIRLLEWNHLKTAKFLLTYFDIASVILGFPALL